MITELHADSYAYYPATLSTALQMGWDRLANGELLEAAEEAAFDLLLTTDRRIRYQQNLSSRKIALVVSTGTSKWSRVQIHASATAASIEAAELGSYTEVLFRYAKRQLSDRLSIGSSAEPKTCICNGDNHQKFSPKPRNTSLRFSISSAD